MATSGSPLLPIGSSPAPASLGKVTRKALTTGRKILVYPPGALPAALRSLSTRTSLKPASIASISDFGTSKSASANQFFHQSSDTAAVTFEELDTIIVKDMSVLGGFSPASVGGSGQMPIIGDDYYVYPVSQGPASSFNSLTVEDLRQILEKIQAILQSSLATAPADVAAPAQTTPVSVSGAQQSWGVNAVQALTSPFTGKNVKVAVIDTGIDQTHPDLQGKIDGTFSYDSVDGGPVKDEVGHGTHVAGTIAGSRSAPLAYAIAPDARLYIAKVFQTGSPSSLLNVIGAINWAILKQCQIANMSLSSDQPLPAGTPFDPTFEALAQNALKKNLLLIAAAGNCADMNDNLQHTGVRQSPPAPVGIPANCPSVLAVAALTQALGIAAFSNAGQSDPSDGQISFAAPGVDIFSSWPTYLAPESPVAGVSGSYSLDSGTSMASPCITGLAALISQKLGGAGGLALWQALSLATVNPLSSLSRTDVGFGMLLAPQS